MNTNRTVLILYDETPDKNKDVSVLCELCSTEAKTLRDVRVAIQANAINVDEMFNALRKTIRSVDKKIATNTKTRKKV